MFKNVVRSSIVLLAAGLLYAPPAEAQFRLPPLLIETDAFPDGGVIPMRNAGPGDNVQPAFTFSNAPDETVSYAFVMTDLDVAFRAPEGFMHWAVWNIPAADAGLPEGGIPEGATQTGRGYRGPGAPAGPRYHHYVFELFALNGTLDLPATASRDEIFAAMEGMVVAKAAYVGRYTGQD